jgi:hypothetical protein
MMKTRLQVCALTLTLSTLGAIIGVARASGDAPDTTLKDIANYKQWTRLNGTPLPVAAPSVGG